MHKTNFCHIHPPARHQCGPDTGEGWQNTSVPGAEMEAQQQEWQHSSSESVNHQPQWSCVQCPVRWPPPGRRHPGTQPGPGRPVCACMCVCPDTTKECVRVCALVCCTSLSVRRHLALPTGIILYLFTCEWIRSAGDKRDTRWLVPHSCNLLTHNAI